MECLVCNCHYEGDECPACDFPVVNFPGNREAGIRALQPTIEAHRKAFLPKVQIGMLNYYYTIKDGEVTERREECVPFGTADALCGQLVWLDRRFEKVTDRASVEVHLCMTIDDRQFEKCVNVPVIAGAQTQEVGILLEEDLQFCIHIRSNTGDTLVSEKSFLFA